MTKNTLTAILSILNGETIDNLEEVRANVEKELNRNSERAQANRELYAEAHDIVMDVLSRFNVPVTAAELFEEIKDELPEGFKKGKVQYALLHYWDTEVETIEGNPNTYKKRA